MIVKATDTDGPSQGGGQVFYSIKSVNTDATVFGIDSVTGQITIVQPVRSDQVEKGLYSLVVRATDAGTPPLHSDVKVTVTAGSTGNQKPVFGQQNYQAKGRHLQSLTKAIIFELFYYINGYFRVWLTSMNIHSKCHTYLLY